MFEFLAAFSFFTSTISFIIFTCTKRIHEWDRPGMPPPMFGQNPMQAADPRSRLAIPSLAQKTEQSQVSGADIEATPIQPSPLFGTEYRGVNFGDGQRAMPEPSPSPSHEIKPIDVIQEIKPPEGRQASPLHPEYQTIGMNTPDLPQDQQGEIKPQEGRMASPLHKDYLTIGMNTPDLPMDNK